jgi:hypothetical protein
MAQGEKKERVMSQESTGWTEWEPTKTKRVFDHKETRAAPSDERWSECDNPMLSEVCFACMTRIFPCSNMLDRSAAISAFGELFRKLRELEGITGHDLEVLLHMRGLLTRELDWTLTEIAWDDGVMDEYPELGDDRVEEEE